MEAHRTNRREVEMSAEARLFQTESGDYWLHDPGIGLLAWIVPQDEAQKALQERSAEMAPVGVLLQLANSHAAYRMAVRDLRRALLLLLKRIKEETGEIFDLHRVLIDGVSLQEEASPQEGVPLQEVVRLPLPKSPLAERGLEAEVYFNYGQVERQYVGGQKPMRAFLDTLQEARIAVSSDRKQALVWFDRRPHQKPLLKLYPFSHPLDGAVWKYARKAVASIAKSMGFLEAAGLGDAMGRWLEDRLKQPPVDSECVGVGIGFPKGAPEGAWDRLAVIYHDRWQRAAWPDSAIWPDLGEDESEDELARFGLRHMVEEIGLWPRAFRNPSGTRPGG
jgi:hypothetical protein